MKTECLIDLLAQDDTPPQAVAPRLFLWSGLALLGSATVALSILGIRADLVAALGDPVVLMKWLLPLAIALPALRAALRLTRPQPRRVPAQHLVAAALAAGAIWLILSMLAAAPGTLWPEMRGNSLVICLTTITLISAVPLGLGLMVLRAGASPAPMRSGGLLGLGVGGLSAALYALHCNEDSPLFFLTWYGLAILIVGAAGALMGRYLLRW
ncbi:NrsF family protein [Paracoccus marinaquae]|uniref:DUF1109 domain-containing protein n=1 Tax=Paracoccus marinaquae TaxID=2841926 RepID=A0ABS6AJU5_9RHOB|nr:DUF1109 domain-containing protein [Paracoccus marinaquae]